MIDATPGSGEMFDAIASRYDFLNRVMSLGIDQRWRTKAVEAMALGGCKGGRALDLATGTADVAIAIALRHPGAEVIGLDPSSKMLDVGRDKIARAGLDAQVSLVLGDAQALDFGDASFDAVSMAFGIRNVPDRPKALREMARVTRPGGRVVILELAEPKTPIAGSLARLHIHGILPLLGAALSGGSAYRYLEKSIAAFPDREVFAAMMQDAGLSVLEAAPLTMGVVSLYVARKEA